MLLCILELPPFSLTKRVPLSSLMGGGDTPIQSNWGRGYPIQSNWQVPQSSLMVCPLSMAGWGTAPPPSKAGWGTSPVLRWGYPSTPPLEMMGYLPSGRMGVPPPPTHPCGQTQRHVSKHCLPPSFRCGW